MASMPFFPSTSKNSCPIGKAKVEVSKSGTDARAKDAAISVSQPRIAVPATPVSIAMGAAFAAFVVSSETCAAESSKIHHPSGCPPRMNIR